MNILRVVGKPKSGHKTPVILTLEVPDTSRRTRLMQAIADKSGEACEGIQDLMNGLGDIAALWIRLLGLAFLEPEKSQELAAIAIEMAKGIDTSYEAAIAKAKTTAHAIEAKHGLRKKDDDKDNGKGKGRFRRDGQ